MKKLSELLERISYTCVQGTLDAEVQEIVNDSRKASESSLFFCIPGAVVNGHSFVPQVVAQGAKVLIVSEDVEAPSDVTVIKVEDTR